MKFFFFHLFCENGDVCVKKKDLKSVVGDVGASSRWAEIGVKWKVSAFPDQAGCTDVPKRRKKGKDISMQGSCASPDERISSFYRLLDA